MGRKTINQKLRFEVFKRDNFRCQYCGEAAPDVVLECDHIIPIAEGGEHELLNLITACFDCNRGKGAVRLGDDQAVCKQRKQLEELNLRREQMEMMVQWKSELANLVELQIDAIDSTIIGQTELSLNDAGRADIRKYIRRFGFEETFEAAQISLDRYYDGSDRSFSNAIHKIGGICYNRKYGRTIGGE